MKSLLMKKNQFSALYFIVTFCSRKNQDFNTIEMENLIVSEKIPYFSFNKDNFTDFRCNFGNEILSSNFVKSPPFYYNKPVRNLILTFSLLFQYSLIKQDKEFKNALEELFKLNQSEAHNFKLHPEDFVYNEQDFYDHLKLLEHAIINIIKGKNAGKINVIEEDERIVITPNNSSSDFTLKLIENLKDDKWDNSESKEVEEAIIEFYTKLKEMYLEDLLQVGYLNALKKAYKESKRNENHQIKDESFKNLLQLYTRLRKLFKENDHNEKQELNKTQCKYLTLFAKMYVNGRFSTYLYEIISKSRAKCFYTNFNEPSKDGVFRIYSDTFKRNIFTFIDLLKKNFQDTKKIIFEGELLTDESFDNLLKNCLELLV
jgi:hypothetical protein